MKLTTILILFLLSSYSYCQKFAPNSIGLAFLKNDWIDSSKLEIAFPVDFLLDFAIKEPILNTQEIEINYPLTQAITLFDKNGLIGKFEADSFRMDFWCENDGGIQFRPTINLIIDKSDLVRPFPKADNYSIVSFAIINQDKDLNHIDLKNTDLHIKRTGDLNNDGKLEAILLLEFDDAQNCSNGLDSLIILRTNGKDYKMSCCGP